MDQNFEIIFSGDEAGTYVKIDDERHEFDDPPFEYMHVDRKMAV